MREHFNEELSHINDGILKMGTMVEEAIQTALKSFEKQDSRLAAEVITSDNAINEMEISLSDECSIVIAREQPVASDLRFLIGCIRIVADLERIGDLAVHLAKATIALSQEKYYVTMFPEIIKMAEIGKTMLKEAITAYINNDQDSAAVIAKKDDSIDRLYVEITEKLIKSLSEEAENVKQATTILFLAKQMERLGDHAVNICEWIMYTCTGEHSEF